MTITIKHTRQQGTLVYGTTRGDGSGKVLSEYTFRGSPNLPDDEELGDPYWYLPHSRRRSANWWKIEKAKEGLESQGFVVEVVIDNTTPATGFDDLEAERYERAESRADTYDDRSGRAAERSDQIRAENARTYDGLNGQPILIGHYSERRHRNLLDRLWRREGKAWELYDKAKYWRNRQEAAERFQHAREAVGTTRRRIDKHEKRLRAIDRTMEGRTEVLYDNPDGRPGSLEEQLRKYADKGIPVTIQERDGQYVTVHVGLSDEYKAVLAAVVVELAEEIGYWEGVLEASGAKLWSKADFSVGDFASPGGDSWHEVVRANTKSVSVAGRFEIGPIHTMAMQEQQSRHDTRAQPLPYDAIKGRLSPDEARERFPQAFAAPETAGPPPRPAKKRGRVRLEHRPGVRWETWYYEVAGQGYRAHWPQPEGWFTGRSVVEPFTGDIPPVKVYKTCASLSRADEPTGVELAVPGPLWYVEQVHNVVRAHVEALAKQVPATPAGD